MHRNRRRAEAHQRIEHEFSLDLRIDLVIDMVDPERNEIIEIALPDCRTPRGLPGDRKWIETGFEALHDLPRAVLAPTHRNETIVAGTA